MWTFFWKLNFEIDKTCGKCDKILTDKNNVEMKKTLNVKNIDKENISAFVLFQRSKAAIIVVYLCDIEINQ